MKYSNSLKSTLIALAVITINSPISAKAVYGAQNAGDDTARATICSNLESRSGTKVNNDFEKAKLNRERVRENAEVARAARFAEEVQKLAQNRKNQDAKLTEKYTALTKLAKTESQLAAVTTFKTKISAAISVHREAIDSAINSFKTGIESLNSENKINVENAIQNYNTAIENAKTVATQGCLNGTSISTIKETYNQTRITAEGTLTQVKQQTGKTPESIAQLQTTKNSAIKAANTSFKATMEQISAEFQTNFTK